MKRLLALLLCIPLISAFSFTGFFIKDSHCEDISENINITHLNLEEVLSCNNIVRDLPKDAKIIVVNSQNQSQKYLIQSKNISKIEEGINPDVKIYVKFSYISELTNSNYLDIALDAINNNDVVIESDKSPTSLFWKYKKLLLNKELRDFYQLVEERK
jgi:hypothetical protein